MRSRGEKLSSPGSWRQRRREFRTVLRASVTFGKAGGDEPTGIYYYWSSNEVLK